MTKVSEYVFDVAAMHGFVSPAILLPEPAAWEEPYQKIRPFFFSGYAT